MYELLCVLTPNLYFAFIANQSVCVLIYASWRGLYCVRALFSYDGSLSEHQGKTCINLSINASTFQSILDYIYTSEIRLTTENIQDILQAADLLLLTDLKDMCCEFLEGCITAHNCIGIRDFTAQLSCPWLHLKVTQYLDEHIRCVLER